MKVVLSIIHRQLILFPIECGAASGNPIPIAAYLGTERGVSFQVSAHFVKPEYDISPVSISVGGVEGGDDTAIINNTHFRLMAVFPNKLMHSDPVSCHSKFRTLNTHSHLQLTLQFLSFIDKFNFLQFFQDSFEVKATLYSKPSPNP